MCLGELSDEGAPHVTGLRVAVQQNYCFAIAGDQIVERSSIDVREVAFDTTLLLPLRGHDCLPHRECATRSVSTSPGRRLPGAKGWVYSKSRSAFGRDRKRSVVNDT